MASRDPYREPSGVLRNLLGVTDPAVLAEYERDLAFFRVVELELHPVDGCFDFAHLRAIHRYILQDIYDWAGELRTVDTRALGIPHARPQFLADELDRVFRRIADEPPSTTEPDDATDTIASHWSELTLVHPFRDGNSRTQRVFFDQMFRHAGWAVDWSDVDATAAHAARHMSVYWRPDYLADLLRHAVHPAGDMADGHLSATLGSLSVVDAVEHFHAMRAHRAAGITDPYGRRR